MRSRGWGTAHAPLFGLLAAFVLLALGYSVIVPLGEAPDEVSHFAYVRWLATRHSLPEPEGAVLGEAFQPPLYYALVAPVTAWQPEQPLPVAANGDWELSDPQRRTRVLLQPPAARWPWRGEALAWHLARWLSPLFGLVTLLATYSLARTVLPSQPWAAWLAVAFVGFLPQFTFQSAVVTNDTLSTMLSALLLAVLARAAAGHEQERITLWALAGVLGGLSVWTKSSGWVFVGTAGLAWLMGVGRAGRWQRLAVLAGSWLLVAAPLLGWNQLRHGDPLGWSLMNLVTDERAAPLTLRQWQEVLGGLYRTFWAGMGGAAHLSLPPLINVLLGGPLVLGLIGLVRGRPPAPTRSLLGWLGLHVVLVGAAWVRWTQTVLGTGQGRLLFAALPAIAVLMAAGWLALVRRERQIALWGSLTMVVGGTAVLGLWVRPLYQTLPPLPPAPVQSTEANWRFGEGLLLRRYSVPWSEHELPGTAGELFFEWEATQSLEDLRLHLSLVDPEGRVVWFKEGTPSAGRDTSDQWRIGHPLASWHRIMIPPGTPPGWHRLLMEVRPPDGDPLPVYGPDGALWGQQVMIGQVTVEPEAGESGEE